jgi:hypothetical protein
MTRLLYSRLDQNFKVDPFSAENSMRDHLFTYPELMFDDASVVEPIEEESSLPVSTLRKDRGSLWWMLHRQRCHRFC